MKKILKTKWAAYTIATCSAVILYMLLSHISYVIGWFSSIQKILNPVITGVVFAYLLNPVMNFFEREPLKKIKKESIKHVIAVILSVIFVLLIATAIVIMVVPSLMDSISGIVTTINRFEYSNITALLDEFNNKFEQLNLGFNIDISNIDNYINDGLNTLFSTLKDNFSSILNEINDIGASVFNFIVGFIIAIYLLIGKKSVTGAVKKLRKSAMTSEQYKKNSDFWTRCHEIFIQYIGCSLFDGLIIGSVNAIFMLIMRMDNITLISVLIGVTNLLPTFGPIIGATLGTLFLVLTNPSQALIFLIFTLILQAVDGYAIKPKLFSSSLGLSPVLSLISIILGGKIFGFTGILLAIPVTAVIVMLYYEKLLPWLQEKTTERELKNSEKS